MLALADPHTGQCIVDRVWFREELYHGSQTHLAPDLLFVAQDYGYLGRELLGTRGAIETSMNWGNGFHRMNGIFLAYGPHVQRGRCIEGATMVDVAPTILYDLGLPLPANMDGHLLTGALEPAFVASNPVHHEAPLADSESGQGMSYTDDERAEIEGRLAALGYIE